MKIKSVEPMMCDGGVRTWIFVRIETDAGLIGYGDCSDWTRACTIFECVNDLGELIIGRDPLRIEDIYWYLYTACQRAIGGISHKAIAGIDSALWDIKGKYLNVPVYELLGGKMRESIPLYWTHCGSYRNEHPDMVGTKPLRTRDDIMKLGEIVLKEGYKAIKTNIIVLDDVPDKPSISGTGDIDRPTLRSARALVETFREALGPDVGIALDVGFFFRLGGVISLARALEPYDMMWLETETMDVQALTTIRMSTKTPICHGESLYTCHGYKPYLEAHAQDIIMPDVAWNGVTMTRKIADMADCYDVLVAPHNCHSPLATLIAGHVCMAMRNFMILEFDRDDVPWRDDMLTRTLDVKDGRLTLPDAPGFGADVNEIEAARHESNGRMGAIDSGRMAHFRKIGPTDPGRGW